MNMYLQLALLLIAFNPIARSQIVTFTVRALK
jgi:hypothetical protein